MGPFPHFLKRQQGQGQFLVRYKYLINCKFVVLTANDITSNRFLKSVCLGWWVVLAEFHQTASVSIWYWVFPTKARMRGRMRGLKKQRRASQPSIFTPPGRGAKVQRVRFITLSHSHALTLSRSRSTFSIQCCRKKTHLALGGLKLITQQGRWVVYRAQFSLQLHLPLVEDLTWYCDSLKHRERTLSFFREDS